MIDLAIIGAGPAGLSAAIYAARAGLDFVVLEKDGYGGGQITSAHQVENYPGAGALSGEALADAFRAQAEALGAEIRLGTVLSVRDRGEYKEIQLEDEASLCARAVIVATGAVPKTLGIPGEELAGVSYCATCDGAFFKGKDVLVVGGGDTAAEDGIYLAGICRHVTVVLRGDSFRAAKRRVDALTALENVTVLKNTRLAAISGDGRVRAVTLEQPDESGELPVDGVFLAVGTSPASDWLQSLPVEIRDGYVLADERCRTSLPGLFAAGDIRTKPLRQAVTAAADGANAVYSVIAWLKENT